MNTPESKNLNAINSYHARNFESLYQELIRVKDKNFLASLNMYQENAGDDKRIIAEFNNHVSADKREQIQRYIHKKYHISMSYIRLMQNYLIVQLPLHL